MLLATLPVLAVWQALEDLGYAEFRTEEGRPALFGALAVCGLQAIAFLATGSVLAPVAAHIVLHGQLLIRGADLPPAMPRGAAVSAWGRGTLAP